MAEAFQAAQCVAVPEFRLELDCGAQVLDESALAWNAEFAGEVALDSRYDFEIQRLHVLPVPLFRKF